MPTALCQAGSGAGACARLAGTATGADFGGQPCALALNSEAGSLLRASPERRGRAVHQQVKTLWVNQGLDGPFGTARGRVSERTGGGPRHRRELKNLALGTRLSAGLRRLAQRPVGAEIFRQARRKGRRRRRQHRSRFGLRPLGLFTTRSPPVPRGGRVNFEGRPRRATEPSPLGRLPSPPGRLPSPLGHPRGRGRHLRSPLGRLWADSRPQRALRQAPAVRNGDRFVLASPSPRRAAYARRRKKRGVVSPRPKWRCVHRLRPKFVRGQLWLQRQDSNLGPGG
jgi:hypothetical protein